MNPYLVIARALLDLDDKIAELGRQRDAMVGGSRVALHAKCVIQERPGLRAPDVARVLGLDRGRVDDAIYSLMRGGEVQLANDSTLSCVKPEPSGRSCGAIHDSATEPKPYVCTLQLGHRGDHMDTCVSPSVNVTWPREAE